MYVVNYANSSSWYVHQVIDWSFIFISLYYFTVWNNNRYMHWSDIFEACKEYLRISSRMNNTIYYKILYSITTQFNHFRFNPNGLQSIMMNIFLFLLVIIVSLHVNPSSTSFIKKIILLPTFARWGSPIRHG